MRKFIISFSFILIGIILADRLCALIMWNINQHTHDTSGPKLKYLFNNCNQDVCFFGASRCHSHYVPSIISDTIGLSVYNAGVYASDNTLSHYIALNMVLSHHKPKVVCLELAPSDYLPGDYHAVTFFAPYFGKCEQIDSVFRDINTYWQYKLCHLYRFNAKAVPNIVGLFVGKPQSEDGFLPKEKPIYILDSLETEVKKREYQVSDLKVKYIQKFIDRCKECDIKLLFVVSPWYLKAHPTRYDVLKEIARKNNIPFLDYHSNGYLQDHPELFHDQLHLCEEGAKIYSSKFASDLKKILN